MRKKVFICSPFRGYKVTLFPCAFRGIFTLARVQTFVLWIVLPASIYS